MKDIRERIKENAAFKPDLRPPFPGNMLIELTNACNHRCIFCANKKKTREIGQINEESLYRILDEAYSLGTRSVGFYTTGEPFLSKNLDKYIAKAKEIGFEYIYLDTNGALATPDRLRRVIEAGLDSIKFSFNAGTRETYKLIHNHDDFDKVVEHIKYVADYRKKHSKPSKIYASFVITKQNQHEVDAVKALIGPFTDDILFWNVSNQGGMMVEDNKDLMIGDEKMTREPPCTMLFNRFHITWEGYLTACCIDYQNNLVVADLNQTTLKEAWNSPTFIALRKRHLEDKLQGTLCYNCLYNKSEPVKPLL